MWKLLLSCFLFISFALAANVQTLSQQIDSRIIGGNETSIADHPYQISLQYYSSHYCGGAIIARTWILTTASCVTSTASSYKVRVGTSIREVGGQLINVLKIIRHPNYVLFDYDIALLQLAEPITLSNTAQIIGLPNNGNLDLEGSIATITGWGTTSEGGSRVSVLREVDVPIISHSVCTDVYAALGDEVTDRMICAGFWEGGKDACSADGGGPLVIDSVVYGLVSWGDGCARPERPGVYTSVGAFRDWITEYTGI